MAIYVVNLTSEEHLVNITNATSFFTSLRPKPIPLAIFLALSVLGVVTNISQTLAVMWDRSSSTSTRILLINLSICGALLFTFLSPPMSVITYAPTHISHRTLRTAPCLLYAGIQLVITAFSFTDFFISLNRFVAICLPHYYQFFKSPKASVLMVFVSWLIPFVVVGCTLTGIGAILMPLPDGSCDTLALNGAGQFSVYLMGIFPYSMVGVISTVVFITAYFKSRSLKASSSNTARYHIRLLKRRLLVARAMAMLLIWSIVSCLPYMILQTLVPSFPENYPNLWEIFRMAPLSEFAFSPMIILGMSKAYRLALLQRCGCASRLGVHPEGTAGEASQSRVKTLPANHSTD